MIINLSKKRNPEVPSYMYRGIFRGRDEGQSKKLQNLLKEIIDARPNNISGTHFSLFVHDYIVYYGAITPIIRLTSRQKMKLDDTINWTHEPVRACKYILSVL